ncbi:MAG: hypothetical protein IPM15_18325 [Betaproteobacteria bacterium]|nr:hypothetical protein [Betaproteobacteria bacterium]MCC6250234.1 hypothetical protein [Rubrivivax sp.]MCL4697064.1 hypothetical protein [Burkholderiaceae bacterium]
MGALTLLPLVAGGFLAGLIVVAAFIAGWELLRQREQLDAMRRDRSLYAASSPLPLTTLAECERRATPLAHPLGAASDPSGPVTQRDPNWIETRPMILRVQAVDDEMRKPRPAAAARRANDAKPGNAAKTGKAEKAAKPAKEEEREPDLLLE